MLLVSTRDTAQVFVAEDIGGVIPAGYPLQAAPNMGPPSELRSLLVHAYYVSVGSSVGESVPALRRKALVGGPGIADEEIGTGVEDLQFRIGPLSFFQTNSHLAARARCRALRRDRCIRWRELCRSHLAPRKRWLRPHARGENDPAPEFAPVRPPLHVRCCRSVAAQPARGFALAACLLLLTVLAILSIAGFTAALVEQRIAANLEQRERAFQAAEYGVFTES